MIVALDLLAHILGFIGSQACRDDARAAWLVIEIAPGLGAAPTVVAGCRQASDSKGGAQRQDVSRSRDRSQQDLLRLAVWKSLWIGNPSGRFATTDI
jgi:hypothetical protein